MTDKPTLTPEHLRHTITDIESDQIDFTIDVCLMMSQAMRIAEKHAADGDYDQYEDTIRDAIAAAGKDDAAGSVIAELFIDKMTHAAWQILTADIPEDKLLDMMSDINSNQKDDTNED